MRHASATQVDAVLRKTTSGFVLTVSDNGLGFDTTITDEQKSLGLLGMRERAKLLGIKLEVTSEQGIGTRVVLEIPITLKKVTSEL